MTPNSKIKKLVLAYSGGLDTSVILRWIKDYYGCEVVAFCADVGQAEELSGLERVIGQLEADLVVALAGGAVGDGVGANQPRDVDLPLADQRPRDRRAEQIGPLVERVGAEHRHDVVAHEFLAQVLDEDLLHAQELGLLARRLDLLALADIGGEGHDLAAIRLLQPFEDDRGVEAPRIGEDDLLDRMGTRGRHERT